MQFTSSKTIIAHDVLVDDYFKMGGETYRVSSTWQGERTLMIHFFNITETGRKTILSMEVPPRTRIKIYNQ